MESDMTVFRTTDEGEGSGSLSNKYGQVAGKRVYRRRCPFLWQDDVKNHPIHLSCRWGSRLSGCFGQQNHTKMKLMMSPFAV